MTNYTTAEELRAHISMNDASKDATLLLIIGAASAAIDQFCNRPDGFVAAASATARVFPGSGAAVQRIDECVAVSSVAVKASSDDSTYEAWASTDWLAFSGDPESPNFNRTPYDFLMVTAGGDYDHFLSGARFGGMRGFQPTAAGRAVPTVQVTARWGYAASVPAIIRQACIIHAGRLYKRGEGAFTDTISSPDFGSMLYTQPLDPDLRSLLETGRMKRPAIG